MKWIYFQTHKYTYYVLNLVLLGDKFESLF